MPTLTPCHRRRQAGRVATGSGSPANGIGWPGSAENAWHRLPCVPGGCSPSWSKPPAIRCIARQRGRVRTSGGGDRTDESEAGALPRSDGCHQHACINHHAHFGGRIAEAKTTFKSLWSAAPLTAKPSVTAKNWQIFGNRSYDCPELQDRRTKGAARAESGPNLLAVRLSQPCRRFQNGLPSRSSNAARLRPGGLRRGSLRSTPWRAHGKGYAPSEGWWSRGESNPCLAKP